MNRIFYSFILYGIFTILHSEKRRLGKILHASVCVCEREREKEKEDEREKGKEHRGKQVRKGKNILYVCFPYYSKP